MGFVGQSFCADSVADDAVKVESFLAMREPVTMISRNSAASFLSLPGESKMACIDVRLMPSGYGNRQHKNRKSRLDS